MQIELIPEDIILKIERLEHDTGGNPQLIASAICASRWAESWWDKCCFLDNHHDDLAKAVRKAGLNGYDDGKRSVRGTNLYYMHFLSPFVPYNKTSRIWEGALVLMSIDHGIRPNEIRKGLQPGFVNSFWYSVGGDRLQDFITNDCDENEFRADILGLDALEEYSRDPSLTLSQLVRNAREKASLTFNGSYRDSEYISIAEEFISPVFGHKVIRRLAKYLPFLCYNGFIPIENPGAIK